MVLRVYLCPTQVLVWSLDDHIDGVLAGSGGGSANSKNPPTLASRSRLEGHTKPVEEVCFKPQTTQELASVGDDAQVRSNDMPALHALLLHWVFNPALVCSL